MTNRRDPGRIHRIHMDGDVPKGLIAGRWFWSHGRSEAGSDKPRSLDRFEAGAHDTTKVSFTPRDVEDRSGIGTQSPSSTPTAMAC